MVTRLPMDSTLQGSDSNASCESCLRIWRAKASKTQWTIYCFTAGGETTEEAEQEFVELVEEVLRRLTEMGVRVHPVKLKLGRYHCVLWGD